MIALRIAVLATAVTGMAGIALAQQGPPRSAQRALLNGAERAGGRTSPSSTQPQQVPPAGAQAPAPADGRAAAAAASQGAARRDSTPARRSGALRPATEAADTAPILMREVFAYERAGRRDPFAPLLKTAELRPMLNELRLTGVLYHPTRPIAVMRDAAGTQYRVTTGMTVGRARVVDIKRRSVHFTITEYGYDRRDSLVLGDTAQVRP